MHKCKYKERVKSGATVCFMIKPMNTVLQLKRLGKCKYLASIIYIRNVCILH